MSLELRRINMLAKDETWNFYFCWSESSADWMGSPSGFDPDGSRPDPDQPSMDQSLIHIRYDPDRSIGGLDFNNPIRGPKSLYNFSRKGGGNPWCHLSYSTFWEKEIRTVVRFEFLTHLPPIIQTECSAGHRPERQRSSRLAFPLLHAPGNYLSGYYLSDWGGGGMYVCQLWVVWQPQVYLGSKRC